MSCKNKILITYTIEDQGFQQGKVMYVAGKEDAKKGDLGTIVLPKYARDVQIDPLLPDPVVFSYTNTKGGIIRLREVLVKIDSDANPQRPSTCTVSVLVPEVGDNWVTRTADVSLVLADGTSVALRNPHGLAQTDDWLYFIDYESRLIVSVKKDDLEGAEDGNGENSLKVVSFDLSLPGNGSLPNDARGQAIIALEGHIYALYIRSNPQATSYDPGILIRLDINSSTGALSYASGTGINNKITVGKNPQSIIPVKDGTNIQLLIPAIGGKQWYDGETNGTDSNICVVQADLAPWPPAATVKITGDDYTQPIPPAPPPAATAFDVHAVAAAMRNGSSQVFILTQVYNSDAKSAYWMLYQTTVTKFLAIPNGTTLTGATEIVGGGFYLLDQSIMVSPDVEFTDDIYFWDLLYEQTLRDDEDEDRLWLVLGSPFMVTKPADYGSPTTPLPNPFAIFSGIGGINVNSVDLTIETLHQAERGVSLKRGMRSSKLGAAAARTGAAAATSMSAEEGEGEEDK
jgi:hypothetical protein